MKKIIGLSILALTLSVQPALAATKQELAMCESIGDLAFVLMDARQQGLDKYAFLNHPDSTPVSMALTERAWDEAIVDDVYRAQTAKAFENKMVANCLQSLSI